MSKPAITVEGLSKAYRIGLKEEIPDTIFQAATGWVRAPWRNLRRLRRLNTFAGASATGRDEERGRGGEGERGSANGNGNGHWEAGQGESVKGRGPIDEADLIWALKDVSFEVGEGEVVGIIGRNGAGKSTLLKVLSRITEPTRGEVRIRGRVSSLLEVGTGFHPELSGRENIYMNGTILGMTKREIDRKFDEIVDFSGVEKFLDTPVKRYSSGMNVRLAFSVAAHLEPEILIIDEVLAVGDFEFQRKCLGKMQDVAGAGRTVLFVSHNMAAVLNLCFRGIVLSGGAVTNSGMISTVVDNYLQSGIDATFGGTGACAANRRAGTGQVAITDAQICSVRGESLRSIRAGEPFRIVFRLRSAKSANCVGAPTTNVAVGIGIFDQHGRRVCGMNSVDTAGMSLQMQSGSECTAQCEIASPNLAPGRYHLNLLAKDADSNVLYDCVENALVLSIEPSDVFGTGRTGGGFSVMYLVPEWDFQLS
jgi:homopolymeric O-antigen transport system ATP-binding protein